MKTLNDYFAMNYRMEIVEDKDEGGFVVSFPELPGCITCGETVESAVANALDAKKAWLEAALEDGIEIHEPDSLEDYSGQFKLRTHPYQLAQFAQLSGVDSFRPGKVVTVQIMPCRKPGRFQTTQIFPVLPGPDLLPEAGE